MEQLGQRCHYLVSKIRVLDAKLSCPHTSAHLGVGFDIQELGPVIATTVEFEIDFHNYNVRVT